MKANDLSQFTFRFVGAGHYMVTYTTPSRGDYWRALITDTTLIDATKNADYATTTAIRRLRMAIRRQGAHFHANGRRIY